MNDIKSYFLVQNTYTSFTHTIFFGGEECTDKRGAVF